jgi:hypothetical protein
VTLAEFKQSLSTPAPPTGISAPLAALWWAANDNWQKAHEIVMDDEGRDAAWVHAYLHRVEGDASNARYWYGQAGRTPTRAPIHSEWEEIASTLLSGSNQV